MEEDGVGLIELILFILYIHVKETAGDVSRNM